MAVICNSLQQAKNLDKWESMARFIQICVSQTRGAVDIPQSASAGAENTARTHSGRYNDQYVSVFPFFHSRTSELLSFYLDSVASFLTSDKLADNMLFVGEMENRER